MNKFIARFYILFIIVSFSKLNAQVNFIWEKRYTSSGNNQDYGKAIAVDASGNVYVTGTAWDNSSSSYNIVTIKYNAFGVQQWIHSYNGTANGIDEGRDIVVDANGYRFGKYPLGFPVVLALGETFKIRWLVNPILAPATQPTLQVLRILSH